MPHLTVACAPRAVGMVLHNRVIEISADLPVAIVPSEFVAASCADRFRDVGVGVITIELIDAGGQRIKNLLMFETVAELAVFRVASDDTG